MWQAQRKTIRENWDETISIGQDGRATSVGEVIACWQGDESFRDFFLRELAATAYPAFFWEMPSIARGTLAKPFECAVIRSDALAQMRADDADFAKYLDAAKEPVAAFPNLGGDALLLAPRRISETDCYGHIAAFVRDAPRQQQHALLQLLAGEADAMLNTRQRFWISTSGLGVPWVHVRMDSYPKYYQYRRYVEV